LANIDGMKVVALVAGLLVGGSYIDIVTDNIPVPPSL
jgi:hypothetical protein